MAALALPALSLWILAQASGPPIHTTPGGSTLDRLRDSTTRPGPVLPPAPPAPSSVWVPERSMLLPNGTHVLVPGHWERQLPDGRYEVPPLVGTTPEGGAVAIPRGIRPPVDQRQAP
jgi:hypothetical protein